MAGVNKVIAIGRLGADPVVRFSQNGTAICQFSLAVNEAWTDKQGQKQERTEWVRVSVFGKQAETCGEYLKKGRTAYVEGKLQTTEQEKDGEKRYYTQVVANVVQFLDSAKDAAAKGDGSFA